MKRLAVVIVAATALASPTAAQESGLSVQFGAITFSAYCTTCHGSTGAGDGDAAEKLAVHPTDLTRLASDNGGVFPDQRVRAAIDGRQEKVGHIGVAMPPWGSLFSHELEEFEEGEVRDAIVSRRLDHLVAYLKSIQR